MSELFFHLSVAVVVFISTNVDDIILIGMLFADRALKPRAVVLGQLVGIGALVAVSGVAGVAALAVPDEYIALLGAVPLALGLQKLWGPRRGDGSDEERARGKGALEGGASVRAPRVRSAGSGVVSVALSTIASGGDNLGAPPEARRRGYATSLVAELSRRVRHAPALPIENEPRGRYVPR